MTKRTPSAAFRLARLSWPCTDSSPPTPGCVQQAEPRAEHPVRHPHLHRAHVPRAGRRHCSDTRRPGPRAAPPPRSPRAPPGCWRCAIDPQTFAVPHERGHARDDVGVDRAGGGLEEGVDEGALPALELPHHRDGDRRCSTIARAPASRSAEVGRSAAHRERVPGVDRLTSARIGVWPVAAPADGGVAAWRRSWTSGVGVLSAVSAALGARALGARAPGRASARLVLRLDLAAAGGCRRPTRGSGGNSRRRPTPSSLGWLQLLHRIIPTPFVLDRGSRARPAGVRLAERGPDGAAGKRGFRGDRRPMRRLRGAQPRRVGVLRLLRELPRLGPGGSGPCRPARYGAHPGRRAACGRRAHEACLPESHPQPGRSARHRPLLPSLPPDRRSPRPPPDLRARTAANPTTPPAASAAGAATHWSPRPRRRRPIRARPGDADGGTPSRGRRAVSTARACPPCTDGGG